MTKKTLLLIAFVLFMFTTVFAQKQTAFFAGYGRFFGKPFEYEAVEQPSYYRSFPETYQRKYAVELGFSNSWPLYNNVKMEFAPQFALIGEQFSLLSTAYDIDRETGMAIWGDDYAFDVNAWSVRLLLPLSVKLPTTITGLDVMFGANLSLEPLLSFLRNPIWEPRLNRYYPSGYGEYTAVKKTPNNGYYSAGLQLGAEYQHDKLAYYSMFRTTNLSHNPYYSLSLGLKFNLSDSKKERTEPEGNAKESHHHVGFALGNSVGKGVSYRYMYKRLGAQATGFVLTKNHRTVSHMGIALLYRFAESRILNFYVYQGNCFYHETERWTDESGASNQASIQRWSNGLGLGAEFVIAKRVSFNVMTSYVVDNRLYDYDTKWYYMKPQAEAALYYKL